LQRILYDPNTEIFENIISYLVKRDLKEPLEVLMKTDDVCYVSNDKEESPISLMQKHSSATILLEFLQTLKETNMNYTFDEIVD
jgi:hypothetical protein